MFLRVIRAQWNGSGSRRGPYSCSTTTTGRARRRRHRDHPRPGRRGALARVTFLPPPLPSGSSTRLSYSSPPRACVLDNSSKCGKKEGQSLAPSARSPREVLRETWSTTWAIEDQASFGGQKDCAKWLLSCDGSSCRLRQDKEAASEGGECISQVRSQEELLEAQGSRCCYESGGAILMEVASTLVNASIVRRDAPPGHMLGLVVARRPGRLRGQAAATATKAENL